MTAIYVTECHLSNGLTIYSNARTPVLEIFAEVFRDRIYVPPDIPQIKENDIVIDIGANIGLFSLLAASVAPSVLVHAFEPSSESFSLLTKNAKANELSNIQCHQIAVSSVTGQKTLYLDISSVCNRALSTANPEYRDRCIGVELVESVSLDDLFDKYGIARCKLLKMDAEGSEYDILLSAYHETLDRIEAIAMEYHQYLEDRSSEEIVEFLKRNGFYVRKEPGDGVGMIYAYRLSAR
jgi:FkbM family methyltransferase